jgi:hypothetical protein
LDDARLTRTRFCSGKINKSNSSTLLVSLFVQRRYFTDTQEANHAGFGGDDEMKLNGRMTKINILMPARGAEAGIHICVVEDLERLPALPGMPATFPAETS